MRSRSLFILMLSVAFGCGAPDRDDDEREPSSGPAEPPEAVEEPRSPSEAGEAGGGTHDAGTSGEATSGGLGAAEPTCPAGTTFDGVGCGRWTPIATSCAAYEEPVPGGFAYGSRCQVAPPLGATFDATRWLEPGGALVDLTDGSRLFVREVPGVEWDSTAKAETWVRASDGEWARVGDATTIERPSEAVLLADGRVLAIGCTVRHRCSHAAAEVFDPIAGAWVDAFVSPEIWPGNDALFALPDGDAVVVDAGRAARIRVEERAWELGPVAAVGMDEPAIELMPDGRALVVGGSLYGWERYAQLLDVETLGWRRAADPELYTFQSLAARAAGGVVVFGDAYEGGPLAKVYTSTAPTTGD